MPSSIPAALDYLVVGVRGLTVVKGTRVSDGFIDTRGDVLVALGVTADEDATTVAATYAQLSGSEEENVELPSLLRVRRTGEGAASRARTDAFLILDAIRELVASDRRLGGAVRPGLPAKVARWALSPTANPRQAGEGRTCEIRWWMTWQHLA